MAGNTYTVKKGDTLWAIAKANNTTVAKLAEINNISNPNYIVVGQVLKLSGSATPVPTNTSSAPVIKVFGLQSNSDRTVYATWTWSKSNTKHYQVKWHYDTGDGIWFVGSDTTTTEKQAVYTAPTNSTKVKLTVKPVSNTRKVNNKETTYWTASWSTAKTYSFKDNPPVTPPTPSIGIEDYALTASLDNLDIHATHIQFEIVKNNSTIFATITAAINMGYASCSRYVQAGGEYKVRCRARRGNLYSGWSDYSANAVTIPSTPSKGIWCKANSKTSVYIQWSKMDFARTYDIEYTTNKNYFEGSDATNIISSVETTHYEKTGLTPGQEYFFRVRSVNDSGHSAWSEICSVVLGSTPVAPTTYSSTTTVIAGEPLNLYWVHNSEDGSSQTTAELELTIDGEAEVHVIKNSTDEDEKDKTSVFSINTGEFVEGTKIQWRVRTAGITNEYGDWSIQRTVDIYAPPTLDLLVTTSDGSQFDTLEQFPFYVSAFAGPNTQSPIGYHLIVTANDSYETVDNIGNQKLINKGEQVYSKYFDISGDLLVEMSANNLDLENNVGYTVKCSVSMDSGLTAEATVEFTVAWTDVEYEPNAEIAIDEETYSASIRPYCEDENGNIIDDITLSVYRREFDGSFTEIAAGIANSPSVFIIDPHPALDFARYRVVAKTNSTGAVNYYDIPGYPVGCKAVVIQWDEEWSNFDTLNEDELEQSSWSGSLLKLPYNIDISDKHKKDVALIEYIGRKRPVSYYGTQLGETSTWNVSIEKNDTETLYALRRLSIWTGDVYVREPSGSGYWANISVSFSQKHRDVTIPVTIEVTRVEGGV